MANKKLFRLTFFKWRKTIANFFLFKSLFSDLKNCVTPGVPLHNWQLWVEKFISYNFGINTFLLNYHLNLKKNSGYQKLQLQNFTLLENLHLLEKGMLNCLVN